MPMSRGSQGRRKPVIGLAGGIGSGKSTVARILESLGAAILDSDRMAHEELREPEVVDQLVRWWGGSVRSADGGADRRAVAKIVFEAPDELARLEGLIYPRLARRRKALFAVLEGDPAVRAIVLDAPKLYEAGLDRLCDAVVFVEADRSARLARLAASRGWTDADLSRRENLQSPLDRKRARADYSVANHADVRALRSKVEQVFLSVLGNC